jgi:hypothetical protein
VENAVNEDILTVYLRNIARQLAIFPTAEIERHVRQCQESLERAESIGPLLDPTAYLKAFEGGHLDDARRQLAIVKHLLAARKAIDEREKFVTKELAGAAP